MSRPRKSKVHHKPDDGKYTQEERERWLYRTADEMREINDLVDRRLRKNGISLAIPQGDEQDTISGKF